MSIVIKGKDMPKNCAECPCMSYTDWEEDYCAGLPDKLDIDDECSGIILVNCPLIELPKQHGRLIDADKLITALTTRWNVDDDQDFANKSVWREIENAPTVIEAEDGE